MIARGLLVPFVALTACNPPEITVEAPPDDEHRGNEMQPAGASEPVMTETTVPANYWPHGVDAGVAKPSDGFRALIMFPIHGETSLAGTIEMLYTPSSPQFRNYLSYEEWMARFAPPESDIAAVRQWIESHGMKVARVARNRLLLQYTGTVGQWNAAFDTELHRVRRRAGTWRNPAYAPLTELAVPQPLVGKIKRLILPDLALDDSVLGPDNNPIVKTPPPNVSSKIVPAQLARTYGVSVLYAQGYRGAGMTFGIIGDTMFRVSDAQSMWQTFGIQRKDPIRYDTMEPQQVHDLEPAIDVQLAGGLAPEAELIFYSGPDNSDTSLLYTFNEAIGQAKAQVLSDSFAHSEYTTPISVARGYNESAMMAAALGITVVSASGDSTQVDVPSDSPYVTAVGGTNVTIDAEGTWRDERSWDGTGCGPSRVFLMPSWQQGGVGGTSKFRVVADVAVAEGMFWMKYQGRWLGVDGTSASSPVFAGILTIVNHFRKAHGKPALGYLNPLLYKNTATRGAFRDIIKQGSGGCAVGPGYDMATGIGSPKAVEMATAIP